MVASLLLVLLQAITPAMGAPLDEWDQTLMTARMRASRDRNTAAVKGINVLIEIDRRGKVGTDRMLVAPNASRDAQTIIDATNASLRGDQPTSDAFALLLPALSYLGPGGPQIPEGKSVSDVVCAPTTCAGQTFGSDQEVRDRLLAEGYHQVPWPYTYSTDEAYDFAKDAGGCYRTEAVICKENCKGGCATGEWTYYTEGPEPDPEPSLCYLGGAAWLAYVAAYHAIC